RNLVICIDGTSDQPIRREGGSSNIHMVYPLIIYSQNTNIIELYSRLASNDDQLTYYDSGIGTYATPSWRSWTYLKQIVDNKIDLAIAWNFEKVIKGAYRWLCSEYKDNGRIFMFGRQNVLLGCDRNHERNVPLGFSRGAYQVSALAGMIEQVGLLRKGNDAQIPLYVQYFGHQSSTLLALSLTLYAGLSKRSKRTDAAALFKRTFARAKVCVHFVGVWDTVSSIGILRGISLPLADSHTHICIFRHALALDEHRVKFLPECVIQSNDRTNETVDKSRRVRDH
ncbi:hypothetical protein PILCRDRAFT_69195, partial [Piloderma croceum F 1598]